MTDKFLTSERKIELLREGIESVELRRFELESQLAQANITIGQLDAQLAALEVRDEIEQIAMMESS